MLKFLSFKYFGKPHKDMKPEVVIDTSAGACLLITPSSVEMHIVDVDGFIHAKLLMTSEIALKFSSQFALGAAAADAMRDKANGAVHSSASVH